MHFEVLVVGVFGSKRNLHKKSLFVNFMPRIMAKIWNIIATHTDGLIITKSMRNFNPFFFFAIFHLSIDRLIYGFHGYSSRVTCTGKEVQRIKNKE